MKRLLPILIASIFAAAAILAAVSVQAADFTIKLHHFFGSESSSADVNAGTLG